MSDENRGYSNPALDEIRARLAKATPGPLDVESHSHPQAGCRCLSCDVTTGSRLDHPTWVCCDEIPAMQEAVRLAKGSGRKQEECVYAPIPHADAKFLAHAQEDVTALLAMLAEVTAERDRLRTRLETLADDMDAYVDVTNGRKAAHYIAGHKHAAKMLREALGG